MSDGITDMYRAARSHDKNEAFIQALTEYLSKPKSKRRITDLRCAMMDSEFAKKFLKIPYFFYSDEKRQLTKEWNQKVRDWVKPFEDGDKEAWAKLLSEASEHQLYHAWELRQVSPFAGKMVVNLRYGRLQDVESFRKFINQLICECDFLPNSHSYFVAFDKPDPQEVYVQWTGSGSSSEKPRNVKGNIKQKKSGSRIKEKI